MGIKVGVSIAAVVALLLVAAGLFKIAGEQSYSNCVAKVEATFSASGDTGDQVKAELDGEREAIKRELDKCSNSPF